MSYQKHSWLNENEQGAIPINKTNLNEIETGIYNAYPVQLIAVSDIEPSECNLGDKYYNTTTKEIYVAIDTNTWSETGETPKSDIAYWVLSQNGNFGWDGTDLVSIGGGKPQVVVSDTEPSGQPTLWIDTGEISGAKSEVVNSMSGNETTLAPSVNAVRKAIDYSTNEIKTGGIWIDGKPTYRKVIDWVISSQTTTYANIELLNGNQIVKWEAFCMKDGIITNLLFDRSITNIYLSKDNGVWKLHYKPNSGDIVGYSYCVIEYTKSTD